MKEPKEWLFQAEYDMGAAEALFKSRRYIYAVFICHLSIEKALKGLYTKVLEEEPPKTHNLILLAKEIGLDAPESVREFIADINRISVATRYPDDLARMQKDYDRKIAGSMLRNGRETLKWLKKRY